MDASTWIGLATAIAAWLNLAVYVAIGLYAKRQLVEYQSQRRDAIRPYVVVDFSVDFLVQLTVSNLGARPARNITFNFSEPLTSTLKDAPALKSRALKEGLPMIPPGKQYSFVWDSARERFRAEGLSMSYEVTVRYTDDLGAAYSDTYILDLDSLSNVSIEKAPWHGVKQAIDDLRREAHKWTDGSGGLLVHSRDKDVMLGEEQRVYAQWRAAREDPGDGHDSESVEP